MKYLAWRIMMRLLSPRADAARYFIVSPYKTATTTVGKALLELSACRREMTFRRHVLTDIRRDLRQLEKTITPQISARDWIDANAATAQAIMAPVMPRLRRYDVFSDAPFGHGNVHCAVLKAVMPSARFIWVDRPLEDWLGSVRTWELSRPNVYRHHNQWHEDPDHRRATLTDERAQLYARFKYTAESFPQDCLELSVEDLNSWDKLAAFCALPAPAGAPAARNVTGKDART